MQYIFKLDRIPQKKSLFLLWDMVYPKFHCYVRASQSQKIEKKMGKSWTIFDEGLLFPGNVNNDARVDEYDHLTNPGEPTGFAISGNIKKLLKNFGPVSHFSKAIIYLTTASKSSPGEND